MGFITKLDYSDNRQIKQRIETFTELSGGTIFGQPFNLLPSGPSTISSGVTEEYTLYVSTFSGNTGTTVYSWFDARMGLGNSVLSALTPSNSGITQNTSIIFTSNTTTVIDDNNVVLTYSGVNFDISVVQIVDVGGGAYTGSVTSSVVQFLSANTLDFTGRTIWVDVSGITRTNRLIISDSPTVGYVWTCLTPEGLGYWSPNTGTTSGSSSGCCFDVFVTGATYNQFNDVSTFRNNTGGTFALSAITYWTSGNSGTHSVKAKNNSGIAATGDYSLAEGSGTTANGNGSHAEGGKTVSLGDFSHAEGSFTTASGTSSHAEGSYSTSVGLYSHSEGFRTTASGLAAHSEGQSNIASGLNSHAEGTNTTASGSYSHAEGSQNTASGFASHAEGGQNLSSGNYSHVEGQNNYSTGVTSHVEGSYNTGGGNCSHAEGSFNSSIGDASHSEGSGTTANGVASHSEGYLTLASGVASHSEGSLTLASGLYSHAEGSRSTASGDYSHAEGISIAGGINSHAEGSGQAYGLCSHAENGGTANADYSHAGGYATATHNYEWARSNGAYVLNLDGGQYGIIPLYTATTNNVQTEMYIDSTYARFTIDTGHTYFINITIVCVDVANGDAKEWRGNCLVKNVAGTVSLVGSTALSSTHGDASLAATSAAISVDVPNEAIVVNVTGLNTADINWYGKCEYTQVRY